LWVSTISLWYWLSVLETWSRITPPPDAMLIPPDPALRGPTHHALFHSFIITVLNVIRWGSVPMNTVLSVITSCLRRLHD
jgi:hypothetical protein